MEVPDMASKAMGGTELMMRALYDGRLPRELLQEFQIIPGRVRDLDSNKIRLLWMHDLPNDPESQHLADGGWSKFHKLVFVSQFQMQAYIQHFNIPWSKCVVMSNAINPLEQIKDKPTDKIKIIYHSTPHRGLNILYSVFEKLAENQPDIELDVYSSFSLYGWEERDESFKELFDLINVHPQCNYYGAVSNEDVRAAVSQSHIFAYPSIWPETSCLCLMEAMSAGALCVHPNYAALPETAANWTLMYQWQDDINAHANMFYGCLGTAIDLIRTDRDNTNMRLGNQKGYVDLFYGWELRTRQWKAMLESMLNEPRHIVEPSGRTFSFDTNQ
jgi:UDP-glucose:(glucosyl)LPS alpha-1,2-glucosyltransferase